MGLPARLSFRQDGKLIERLDARCNAVAQQTGEKLTRSALMRQTLRMALGDSSIEAAIAESHFALNAALHRALTRLVPEMQARMVELVREELENEAAEG